MYSGLSWIYMYMYYIFSFFACSCTEKERHANQSTEKKASDHLFGFSGNLSTQELGV